jgi:hypothetical protein
MYHRRILPRKLEGASEKLDLAKKKKTEFLMTLEGFNLCEKEPKFFLSLVIWFFVVF